MTNITNMRAALARLNQLAMSKDCPQHIAEAIFDGLGDLERGMGHVCEISQTGNFGKLQAPAPTKFESYQDWFYVCRHPAWPDPLGCLSAADAVRSAKSPASRDTSDVMIVHKREYRQEYQVAQVETLIAEGKAK